MGAPRLIAPTTVSGGIPTAGAGTLNTVALWTPDGFTLGNSLLTQSGSIITNLTGAIRANGTSQTSPAFMRHDATNTGIYFPGVNEIGFTISGTHAIYISTSRNVGIGTTSPTQKLRVEGAVLVAGAATLGATASAGTLSMESTVFRQYTGDGTGWTWAIAKRTGSVTTDMMYITDSGGSLYVPGADSFFFGVRVGRGGGNQTSNTAVGASTLAVNVGGTNNTAVGSSALSSNVSGSNNTALGSAAGSGGTGSSNTYIGFATASGGASSGNDNTLIGAIAGNQITSGSNNVCIGSNAGQSQTVANDCTYVGKNAGYFFSGSSNTAVGRSAMTGASFATSTGTNNSAFGTQAGVSLTSGSSNVLLGWGAGNTLTTGSQNICIGVSATPAAATNSNTLVIGSSANWVATQGAATTYFTTATALSTGTLPATCGFMRVYLNGSWVKIPVYAD